MSRPARSIPELVGEVILVMRELARDSMTMVIGTHEMGFARDAAIRMVFIDRGQVIETGTPGQFFSAPATGRARRFFLRCRYRRHRRQLGGCHDRAGRPSRQNLAR